MSAKGSVPERTCPGERSPISLAICRTRQRNQYPKCLLCPHRNADLAGANATDPKVLPSVFRSTGVLGRVPQELNEYVLRKVGLAAAQFLRAESPKATKMVVGCDLRDNSRSLARVFCEGVNAAGTDVVNVGPWPPDVLVFALGTDGYAGAAFIGGGNYPDTVNGVRLWRRNGRALGSGNGLEKISLIARRLRTGRSRLPGETSTATPLADYLAYVRRSAKGLTALKLVVDGGNGVAGRLLERLLTGPPVQLTPVHFEEDAHSAFLGRRFPSNSLVASMRAKVQDARADAGLAVDFSGERVAFFDEHGALLRHDVSGGIIALEVLEREGESTVAYDLRSTAALASLIKARGGEAAPGPAAPLAFDEHVRTSEAAYGFDLTGLHYFSDFFGATSPFIAAMLFCSCVCRERKAVSELAAPLMRLSRSEELVVPAPSADAARDALEALAGEFSDADHDRLDGLTVRLRDYWFNLRQPGEAAELRLIVEGRSSRDERRGRQTIERSLQRALQAGS